MSTSAPDEMTARDEATSDLPPEGSESRAVGQVFSVERFEAFCGKLKIDSKEHGRIPLRWLGTQRYFVEKVAEGLNNDIHTFVVLKGRQVGISTVSLALDLYWPAKNPGLQGAIVTDTDENREVFRSYVDQYHKSLPSTHRSPIARHNRTQLVMRNGSRLVYMVAGEKKKGNLGRAKSANYLHATECSSWGDEEGFGSLMNTLAQKNPNRLYIFESTARGYNMFYTQWEIAKSSPTQMAIFIGWWRNELYQWEENSKEFQEFWDGTPTSDELVWIKEIFEEYGYEVTPQQIAWWRWYVAEHMKGDELLALQEMPPTENYAFQLSGSKFFSTERVNIAHQRAIKLEPLYYRYQFGINFEDTQFVPANRETYEVAIWHLPDPRATYALGCDPAFGSSEWADEFAGCLCRCYADKMVQALEIGAVDWTEQQYAWVIAHIAGWYGDVMLNLEMQGPGTTVFNELRNLQMKRSTMAPGDPRAGAFDVIGRIRDYLWRKQDSMNGSLAYQWQTTSREKIRMMSTLRSYFERDMIEVNSSPCLQQFRNVRRDGDKIGGEGRAKDDRVIALALTVIAWNDWLMADLQVQRRTYELEHRDPEQQKLLSPVERSVMRYLDRVGIKMNG